MVKRGTPVKSPSHPSVRRRGLVLAVCTLTSGVCMTWFAARDWTPTSQPARLSRLPDAELAPHLRELVQQGRARLARVVEALGEQRIALHLAAARTLHEEIERCTKASTDEAASQLDAMAGALATYAPQFNGEALATAAALAERILAAPMPAKMHNHRLRHCHVVLKEEAERRMQEQARSPAAGFKSTSISHDRATAELPSRTSIAVTVAPLAGGGLAAAPNDLQPGPLPPQVISQARPLGTPDIDSSIVTSRTKLNSPSRVQASARHATHTSEEATIAARSSGVATADDTRRNLWTKGASAVQSTAANQATPPMPRDLARLLELAERVRFGDSPHSAATKAELQWLGIDELQLKLARGAIDDDPRVRQEVVEALAQVKTVDARGWLLWLSHDRDTEVRRAAISLMATASDPELKKRVRQAAEGDPDSRVRDLARAGSATGETRP